MIARFLTRQGNGGLVLGIPVLPLRKRLVTGLTLVEVLVVFALAGIFLALLLPAFQGSLLRAHKAQSIVNLRQLAVAVELYAPSDEAIVAYDTRRLVQVGLLPENILTVASDTYPQGQMNASRQTFIPHGQPVSYRDSVLNGYELMHPRLLAMIRQSGTGGWARIAAFGPALTPKWSPRHSSKSLLLRFDGSVGYAQDDRKDREANTCDWFSFPLPCPPHKPEDFLE